jgi:tetratricopeptide (TPR) repeat protein
MGSDRSTTIPARVGDGWIGKLVVPRHGSFTLREGNRLIDPKWFRIYRVKGASGTEVFLKAEGSGLEGWAPAREVVPLDQADAVYTQYIKSNKSQDAAYSYRAGIYLYQNKYDLAVADATMAIRLDPTHAIDFSTRGLAWKRKGEHGKAISDFSQAVRLAPDESRAYTNRGDCLIEMKQYDKAIADCDQAIRLDPDDARPYYCRGLARDLKKEYRKAAADLDDAIRLDPYFTRAISRRAYVSYERKEYDRTIAYCGQAIKVDPDDHFGYYLRARLWAACPDARYRDGKRAIESATRACELTGWKVGYAVGSLAAAHAETGDFDAAVKWQAKANTLYPTDEIKARGEVRLKLYRDRKPYREDEI